MAKERAVATGIKPQIGAEQLVAEQLEALLPALQERLDREPPRHSNKAPRKEVKAEAPKDWLGVLIDDLDKVVLSRKRLVDEDGRTILSHKVVRELRKNCKGPDKVKSSKHFEKLKAKYGESKGRVRWLGGKLRSIGDLSKKKNSEIEGLAARALPAIRLYGEHVADTPDDWFPEEVTPPQEILHVNLLNETMESIVLSDNEKSIAAALCDPVELAVNGVLIKTHPANEDEQRNYGFTLPKQLLEIIHTFRHIESFNVLQSWLINGCYKKGKTGEREVNTLGAENALKFLQILVNFTSFLDSKTHLELYAPPKVDGRDKEEFYINPFQGLRKCLGNIAYALSPHYKDTVLYEGFKELLATLELRYAEVYSGAKQSSLFTAEAQALIPRPRDFARSVVRLALSRDDVDKTALGIIRMAESSGVEDITQVLELLIVHERMTEKILVGLINDEQSKDIKNFLQTVPTDVDPILLLEDRLGYQIKLRETLIREAEKAGFLEAPGILPLVKEEYDKNPWPDLMYVDWAEVIKPETTNIEFYAFTGTFGPFTTGHYYFADRILSEIKSLPEKEDDRVYQRFLLVMPITDVASIAMYEKDPAKVGTLIERTNSAALSLSLSGYDKNQVFIVTTQQSHPGKHKDTRDGVLSSTNVVFSKIVEGLDEVDRSAPLTPTTIFAFGADELEWEGQPRRLAPREKQRRKVLVPRSIMVVRRGWLLATLRESDKIAANTGIEKVILTSTPETSSSEEIKQRARTGRTKRTRVAAQWYIDKHWSPQMIEQRRNLPHLNYTPMMRQVNRALISELDEEIKKTEAA